MDELTCWIQATCNIGWNEIGKIIINHKSVWSKGLWRTNRTNCMNQRISDNILNLSNRISPKVFPLFNIKFILLCVGQGIVFFSFIVQKILKHVSGPRCCGQCEHVYKSGNLPQHLVLHLPSWIPPWVERTFWCPLRLVFFPSSLAFSPFHFDLEGVSLSTWEGMDKQWIHVSQILYPSSLHWPRKQLFHNAVEKIQKM